MKVNNPEISIDTAAHLLKESKSLFTEVFKHGTLIVEFYKPDKTDPERDEIYVVATGTGVFNNGGNGWNFKPEDFLFVPAVCLRDIICF